MRARASLVQDLKSIIACILGSSGSSIGLECPISSIEDTNDLLG